MTSKPRSKMPHSKKDVAAPARRLLDHRKMAMMLLRLVQAKEHESKKKVTRARIGEPTLRRLWGRNWFTSELITEVNEWLVPAGWILFFAGSQFAIIRVDVVEGWMRISAERITDEITAALRGEAPFSNYESLLLGEEPDAQSDAESDD